MRKILLLFVMLNLFQQLHAQTWVSVGSGVNGRIQSYAILNNDLFVSVISFSTNSFFLKKWDGFSWTTLCPLGYDTKLTTYNNQVYGAYVDPSSRCIVVRFNGTSLDTIGISNIVSSQFSQRKFVTLEVFNNELYVGTEFTEINGVAANRIARWNNNIWNAVGNGLDGQPVGLLSYNSNLYVAGEFTTAGSVNAKNIAKWDGVNWDSLGTGLLPDLPGSRPAGNFYFGGLLFLNTDLFFSAEYVWGPPGINVLTDSITQWDGAQWTPFPSDFQKMALFNNTLYFIKYLTTGRYLKTFDGTNLTTEIIDNTIIDTMFVHVFFVFNNELYVGGEIYANNWNLEGIVKLYDPLVSIDNNKLQSVSDFNIYPNPASSSITINGQWTMNNGQLKIMNAQGQLILQSAINNRHPDSYRETIDVSTFNSGLYYLTLQTEQGVATKKFEVIR